MAIKDEIDLSSPSPPRKSGGSGDIKLGRHKGHAVVVKTLMGSNAELKKVSKENVLACEGKTLIPPFSNSAKLSF